ncbi:MAG: ParB/RepB/Spo0J family partition protein [Treponema sp.]|nr:ParB/RepB/Spo0J family partition protein [Treponema sp.]
MASKHSPLGKGVDALFPPDDREDFAYDGAGVSGAEIPDPFEADTGVPLGTAAAKDGVIIVPLDKIAANPGQPRRAFAEEGMKELADSIREHGIISPPIVEETGDGTYMIVMGERRIRAAKEAGLTEAPVLVRAYSEEKRMEVALVENIQRVDLNPVEEAMAYRQLMELTGLSQDDVAARVGKNRSTVANTLRLLKLPRAMLDTLVSGLLSPGHGRALLSVTDGASQEALFREITGKGLSVREAEKRAAALNAGQGKSSVEVHILNRDPPPSRDPELAAMEQRFIDTLGTKVAISGDLEKGTIKIDYYSMDDLDRLLGILGGPG